MIIYKMLYIKLYIYNFTFILLIYLFQGPHPGSTSLSHIFIPPTNSNHQHLSPFNFFLT